MNPPRAQIVTSRLIFGLFLAAAGFLLAADRFGFIDAGPYWHYWPLLLISVGVTKLLQPYRKSGGVLLVLLGSFFLMREMGWTDLDFSDLFPFLLLFVGLSLVVTAIARRGAPDWGPRRGPGRRWEAPPADSSSTVDSFAMLGSSSIVSNSPEFRGGTATAIAGACQLDLRQATIAPEAGGEAVLDTFAFWGGIEILVPETWSVVLRGTPLLGGFDDRTLQPAGGSAQRLVVKGLAIMGAVEVKNVRDGR